MNILLCSEEIQKYLFFLSCQLSAVSRDKGIELLQLLKGVWELVRKG